MKSSKAGLVGILALAAIAAGHGVGLGLSTLVAVLLSLVFGLGWPRYLEIPAKKTLGGIIAGVGVCAALTTALTKDSEYLVWSPIYIAVGFGAIMVVQVIRGTGQSHRLESTIGAAAGVAIAGFSAGWIASLRFLGEPGMTLITVVSAAVAIVVGMLPWPDRISAPVAIVLAALAGSLTAMLVSELHVIPALIVGVLVGAVIASFHRLKTLAGPPADTLGGIAAALAPVLSLGSLVYFLDKLLLS